MSGFVAATTVDPEQSMWSPGSRTIFLPLESRIIAPPKPELYDTMDYSKAVNEFGYFAQHYAGLSNAELTYMHEQFKAAQNNHWYGGRKKGLWIG